MSIDFSVVKYKYKLKLRFYIIFFKGCEGAGSEFEQGCETFDRPTFCKYILQLFQLYLRVIAGQFN